MGEKRKSFGNTSKIGELINQRRAKPDDNTIPEKLLETVQEQLRRLARSILNRDFADLRERGRAETDHVLDFALQEIYLAFKKNKFDSPKDMISYAAKIMRSRLKDEIRKYRKEREKTSADEIPDDPRRLVRVEHSYSAAEIESLLNAVDSLPEPIKSTFDLRWAGVPRKKIAVLLGIDEKTVTRRCDQAKQELGRRIGAQFRE